MKRQIDGLSHRDKFLALSSSSHHSIPFTRLRFHQLIEIVVCTSALVFAWVFADWELRDRPIPYQYLEQSGEYIKDLVHDESLNYVLCINNFLLHLLAIFWPILFQIAWTLVIGNEQNWFDELHAILCSNFSAMAMVWFVVYAIKCHVGYLRPVFYQYCEPSDDYQECTLKKDFIHYSFPSAHTSDSFCGMTILALFLDRTWRQYNVNRRLTLACDLGIVQDIYLQKKVGYTERFVSLLCMVGPFSVACLVGCTRMYNNFHYPSDVLAGALLGSTISYYCYGLWFDHGRDVCMTWTRSVSPRDSSSSLARTENLAIIHATTPSTVPTA